MLTLLVILTLSYLIGSIPTSILAARWLRGIDIRQHGSGNAGATNVFRTLGKGPGMAVMAIDLLKGVLAVALGKYLRVGAEPAFFHPNETGWLMVIAGAAAVLGHIYTVYAGFKGGKGVATGAGVVVALAPVPVLVGLGLFTIIVATTRYVSLASMAAAASLPLTQVVREAVFGVDVSAPTMWFCIVVPFLIFFTHRANIGRLLHGTESRVGAKKG
ncbi:MAG: glycerol-3-phosphate 1-O-acyltransferase PlsY [Bacteroidota bacterium]